MRTIFVVAGIVLLIGSTSFAGGDKAANAVADPSGLNGGANGFTNGTSAGAVKSAGCKIQGKIAGITGLADGDVVICIGAGAVYGTPLGPSTLLGNAAIIRGVHTGGQINFKADLTGVGCGNATLSAKIVSLDPTFACYKPDAAYSDPTSPSTNWHTSCAGIPVDNPAAATGLPAKVATLGVCQATSGSANPQAAPLTGEIFETGQTILAN